MHWTPDDPRGSFLAGRVCLLVALGVFRVATDGTDIKRGRRMVLEYTTCNTLEISLVLTKFQDFDTQLDFVADSDK